jgi:hypothetical protein
VEPLLSCLERPISTTGVPLSIPNQKGEQVEENPKGPYLAMRMVFHMPVIWGS